MQIIPDYLYLYKSFDDDNYWKEILDKKRLYMACPNQFNDPFEGRLFPFYTGSCGNTINLSAGKANKDVGQFLNNYRVLCLSSNIRNKAMWAYYADDYRGFAIRFKTTSNVFASAERVVYKSPNEEIMYRSVTGPREGKEIQRKCLLYKSDDWKQEEEFRIIKYSKLKRNRFLRYKYDDIDSVILGERISDDNKEIITKICNNHNIKIRNMWLVTIESKIEFYSKEAPHFDGGTYKRFIDKDI